MQALFILIANPLTRYLVQCLAGLGSGLHPRQRGVAGVRGADLLQHSLGEHVRHQANILVAADHAVMVHGHTAAFLSAVLQGEKVHCHTEVTDVFFRSLSDEEIRDYIRTKDPMDKAGSYGIQSGAAVFVEKILGDYYNVVGLPVCRLAVILKEFL